MQILRDHFFITWSNFAKSFIWENPININPLVIHSVLCSVAIPARRGWFPSLHPKAIKYANAESNSMEPLPVASVLRLCWTVCQKDMFEGHGTKPRSGEIVSQRYLPEPTSKESCDERKPTAASQELHSLDVGALTPPPLSIHCDLHVPDTRQHPVT